MIKIIVTAILKLPLAFFDKGYCQSFATSKVRTYLCRNSFYCEPDEWSDAIISITHNNSTYDHCMYQKSNNYEKLEVLKAEKI